MVIRTLVVDDEPLARSSLCQMLGSHPDIEVVGQCGSGVEALAAIRQNNPDLLFLDVQMPECDGFEVVERLGNHPNRVIIFVTAYDQYAIRAFEAGALDYLLKPFDATRLSRALARARGQIAVRKESAFREDRLLVKNGADIVFVRVADINWIEAADYYACLHVGSRTYLLQRSLSHLATELDQDAFLRIHRSFIVSQSGVQRLVLNANGDYDVVLMDGTKLRLSRRYRNDVLKRLGARTDKVP